MKEPRRARELTREEKDFIVYDLLESTVLSFGASARLSRDEMRRQFDNAKETLERMKHDLGEEYVDSMKGRLESLWEMRAKLMAPTGTEASPSASRGPGHRDHHLR